MKVKVKELLSIMLVLVMCLALLPMTTFAATGDVSFASGGNEVTTPVNGLTAVAKLRAESDDDYSSIVNAAPGEEVYIDVWFDGTVAATMAMEIVVTTAIPGIIINKGRTVVTAGDSFTGPGFDNVNIQVGFRMPSPTVEVNDLTISLSADTVSSDSTLKSLEYAVGEYHYGPWVVPVPGFSPTTYTYNIELPLGASRLVYLFPERNCPYTIGGGGGASGNTYTIDVVAEDRTTSTYTVIFTWATTGTPIIPPTITSEPADSSIMVGSNTTFTAAASGTPMPSYLWYEINSNVYEIITNGGIYSGADTATLTLTGVTTAYNGNQYFCRVYNAAGTVSTRSATLTVTTPVAPTITGLSAMSLTVGYAATSTTAYTIGGTAPVVVAKTSGDAAITWNSATQKLDIAAGLAAGNYPVVLTASNGILPDATLTFTLTVNSSSSGGTGGGGGGGVSSFSVSFNTNGGSAIASRSVSSGA